MFLFVGSQGRGCLETCGVPVRRYWYKRSRFRVITLLTYLFSQLLLYRELSRAHLSHDAVIYVNTLLPFGAAIWGWMHGRTVVYHLHEVSLKPRLLQRFLTRIVETCAHHAFYVSLDHRKRLPIARVPSSVLPNPVPQEIAVSGFNTRYTPRRSGNFEVLMLASPRDFKGIPEFLDLARRLIGRTNVSFTLVLNDLQPVVDRYIPLFCRPANVKVHARTNEPSIYYATADVLLNLSRVDLWVETFGLTIIEAMAYGVPVIAPPVGGPAEIITDGYDGYLVDSRDKVQLEQRLCHLINNSSEALGLSRNARERVKFFTMDQFAGSLVDIILPLRGKPSGRKKLF